MASNNISKYYKVDEGLDLTSDSQFATLSANEKLVYKPSGEKYIKNSNYSNVFDKTNTFGELETKINTKAVGRIENTNNSDGTTNYYSIDGTKLGSFISGVSPKDLSDGLGNVRSTSITRIDDANTSTGICSCKNSSGTQIDTFTCHVPVSNNNSSLNWGQTSTIGTVDGTPLTVKMPANPSQDLTEYISTRGYNPTGDSQYRVFLEYHTKLVDGSSNPEQWSETGWYIVVRSPGTGLPYEKYLIFTNPPRTSDSSTGSGTGNTEEWSTFYFADKKEVGDIVSGSNLFNDYDRTSSVGSGSWRLMWINVNARWTSGTNGNSYYGKFQKVG